MTTENNFTAVFLPWDVRPGRDEAWMEERRKEYDSFELEKEYPATVQEFLAPPQSMMFFQAEALQALLRDIRVPLEERLGGAVKIWRRPVVAGRYVAFGDFAWGETMAYDCMVVMDFQTGEQVAEVYGRLADDEMARLCVETLTLYNRAYFGGEYNGEGINVLNKMIDLGYGDRMYNRGDDWKKNEKHRGWLTDAGTRPVMLGELEEAVRVRRIVVHCKEAVDEMFSFIRTDRGRPEHANGSHDDHVMAWAGAWQMRKFARFGTMGTKPVPVPSLW
jgi:hypothetical protein